MLRGCGLSPLAVQSLGVDLHMTLLEAIIRAIIHSFTEVLPVSPRGHLAVAQYVSALPLASPTGFSVILHVGSFLAVVFYFRRVIFGMLAQIPALAKSIFAGKFSFKDMPPARRLIFMSLVAFVPLIGTYYFREYFAEAVNDNDIIIEGICFIITSILICIAVVSAKKTKNSGTMNLFDAFMIGLAQAISPMPGISRTGATVSMGLIMGLTPKSALAFSFIIGIPFNFVTDILSFDSSASAGVDLTFPVILAGVVISFVFTFLAIKLLSWMASADRLKFFAWYMVIAGSLVIGFGVFEKLSGNLFQAIISELAADFIS